MPAADEAWMTGGTPAEITRLIGDLVWLEGSLHSEPSAPRTLTSHLPWVSDQKSPADAYARRCAEITEAAYALHKIAGRLSIDVFHHRTNGES
jgi:hypothetical protein